MKTYLVDLPYTGNSFAAKTIQKEMLSLQGVLAEHYGTNSRVICWEVKCEEEQLTLLTLIGARYISPFAR